MPKTTSAARWRDDPVIPTDYEDLAGLIKLARKARGRVVEFDWLLTSDEVRCLRRAVFEWGTPVVGRYRCFDARVLAAINEGLGEPDTVFILNEPKGSQEVECAASCARSGDGFRLTGHAPFDVIFGYGSSDVGQGQAGSPHLGLVVQDKLAGAVDALGWDTGRLGGERFRPVRNALYGLRVDYAVRERMPVATIPPTDLPIHFHGPFAVSGSEARRCIFTDELAMRSGVYLWTINVGGKELPWYVGQTGRSFAQRTGEHVASFLSGEYTSFDADALSRGEYRLAGGALIGRWPETLPAFLGSLDTLMPNISKLLELISFHVVPLVGDDTLLNRVEGAIGRYFKSHADPELRAFLMPGLKLPAAMPGKSPIRMLLSSECPIAGMPREIIEPSVRGAERAVPNLFPTGVREFVELTPWTFAKTYASTWPHEYVVRTPENAELLLGLARHIFEHGVEGYFYEDVRKYHHEDGKVYWSMDPTAEATDLINRCDEAETYDARLKAGTLPTA